MFKYDNEHRNATLKLILKSQLDLRRTDRALDSYYLMQQYETYLDKNESIEYQCLPENIITIKEKQVYFF